MFISSLYNRPARKTTVNTRRINRERMRVKLAKASFVNVPRLCRTKVNVN